MEAAYSTESAWLNGFVPQICEKLRERLVAHRGFHCPLLSSDRPLECTKPALKIAWDSGLRYCECDVRLSSDGKIMLLHDPNLDKLVEESAKPTPNANEITAEDLISWPLLQKDVHLTYLEDVLLTALESGSRLVIELKGSPGSPTVGSAVARLLQGNPQLLEALQTLQWQFSMSAWSKTTVRIGNRTLFCRFSCQIHWYTQCFVMRLCLNKNRLFRDTSSCLFFCVTSCPQSGSQCKSFSSMPLSSKSAAVHPSDMELLQRRNKRQLNTNSHQQKRSWFLPFRKRTPQPHISPKCEQRKTSFF
ncbi:Putative glycerophosphoryl diester phosphodiesterase YhdW [Durusdinium trenchii]|uniref:Glycerophosphoryl diester phosphodiesterase YhdW n=1 Tax=Durusdinium trenchii TaxID=1381693 RepID=A0ABP0JWK7_9DINO